MPRFIKVWRNAPIMAVAVSTADLADRMEAAARQLRAMQADGVRMEGVQAHDRALLVTEDPEVAARYGMKPENPEDEDVGVGGA